MYNYLLGEQIYFSNFSETTEKIIRWFESLLEPCERVLNKSKASSVGPPLTSGMSNRKTRDVASHKIRTNVQLSRVPTD